MAGVAAAHRPRCCFHQTHARAFAPRRDRGTQSGHAAADNQHVRGGRLRHRCGFKHAPARAARAMAVLEPLPLARSDANGICSKSHPFQGLCLLKQTGPDADGGNFAQDEGSFAQVRCKISSRARGDGVMLVHQ